MSDEVVVSNSPNTGEPVVTKLASGGWVVAWQSSPSSYDIVAQLYDTQGAKVGGEFTVNTTTDAGQFTPTVASLPGGGFIVTWMDANGTPSVRSQRFDDAGTKLGGEVIVGYAPNLADPDVSVAPDGSYIVSWKGAQSVGGSPQITQWIARFDAAGNRIGNPTSLPTLLNTDADWVALSNGHFVVAYTLGDEVRAAFVDIDATGVHFGTSFLLNDPTYVYQAQDLSLVQLADGNFAVAWANYFSSVSTRVFGAGGPIGEEASVTNSSIHSGDLRLAALSGGGYSVSWTPASGTSTYTSMARTFDNGGDAIGGAWQVNQSGVNPSAAASIVSRDATTAIAVYPSMGSTNILMRIVDLPIRQNGSPNADTLTGNAGPDEINGFGGNDTINAADGNDELHGGDGADTLGGGNGTDWIAGDAGTDQITGGDGDDWLFAARMRGEGSPRQTRDGLDTGSEFDSLSGGAGDDQIYAGLGDNVDGGSGHDALHLSVAAAAAGITADFSQAYLGNATLTVAGGTITGVELLGWFDGSAFDDTIVAGPPAEIQNLRWYRLGTLHGNGGNDNLTAGYYTRDVYGDAGNDTLAGSNDGDLLVGGAGADTLSGGIGRDVLSSGDGSDAFYVSGGADLARAAAYLDHGAEVDTLSGGADDDTLVIGYGDNADGGAQYAAGDTLYISLMGATSGVTVQFGGTTMTLGGGTITGIEKIDLVEGSAFNDTISFVTGTGAWQGEQMVAAGGGDDVVVASDRTSGIDGGDGNDQLDARASTHVQDVFGGAGDDLIRMPAMGVARGGDGNDTIHAAARATGDAGDDLIILSLASSGASGFSLGGTGNDEIRASASGNVIAGNAGADYLIGGVGNDILYVGDVLANSTSSVADMGVEHDRVVAGDGNDTVAIGYGDDADGGAGTDTLVVSLGGGAAGVTLSTGSFVGANPFALGGGTVQGFETLTSVRGTEFDDVITASAQATTLSVNGGAGNDVLIATTSNVTLVGGDGNDRLVAGSGVDTLDGGLGIDTADFSASSSAVTIQLAAPGALTTLSNGDRLANIENLIGSGFADVLWGNAIANVLSGGGGGDHLHGGLGDDVYNVLDAGDLVFEDAGAGTDTVNAAVGHYLHANVENLNLAGGAGDIYGVGNELANTITGNEGANTLLGGAGADTVNGGAGIDIVYGEDGADQLFGDADNDFLAGGDGDDTIQGGTGGDSLYGEAGNDTLTGGGDFVFDRLVGGDGNDVLRGDSGMADYDYLYGNLGDDSFYVDTGDDLTFEQAGEGTDTVYANVAGANNGVYLYANVENLVLLGTTTFGVGNELANTMTGSASGNWLLGGAGNDVLNGKGGNDVLFGEGGADTFIFEAGTGGDVIGDFQAGTDRIDLSAYFSSWQDVANSMHEHGGTTAIDLGGGNLVVLNGVAKATLSQSDFILGSGAPDEPQAFAAPATGNAPGAMLPHATHYSLKLGDALPHDLFL